MSTPPDQRILLKFLVTSALFFFIGTVHGVLQVLPPIRAWLDSIGSPYGGPGHMIDPLAHAHINVVGGVVLLCMAVTYFMCQAISGRPVYSRRLINHSFWWTAIGVGCFYSTLLIFGILEGHYLLNNQGAALQTAQQIYGPVIGIVSTGMGMGFWLFFANIYMTIRDIYRHAP